MLRLLVPTRWFAAVVPTEGKMLVTLAAIGLMRFAGMIFPGNGLRMSWPSVGLPGVLPMWVVAGSSITGAPVGLVSSSEKSPVRILAVGYERIRLRGRSSE